MKTINIVGSGPGYEKSKGLPGETWAVSSAVKKLESLPDKVFQLHPEQAIDWVDYREILVVKEDPGFPCEILPVKELLETYGPRFGSSITWMIGYAMMFWVERINIVGVQMISPREYLRQRDSLFYMIGRAEAAGVVVWTPKDSGIQTNFNY